MLQKLRTVIYHVTDLQQAKDWYIQLTGKQPYFDEPFYVGFDFDGCELGLHPQDNTVVQGNQAVAYWAVADVEQTVNNFVANGAAIQEPVTEVGGGIKVATVIDPWGNAVGFISGA